MSPFWPRWARTGCGCWLRFRSDDQTAGKTVSTLFYARPWQPNYWQKSEHLKIAFSARPQQPNYWQKNKSLNISQYILCRSQRVIGLDKSTLQLKEASQGTNIEYRWPLWMKNIRSKNIPSMCLIFHLCQKYFIEWSQITSLGLDVKTIWLESKIVQLILSQYVRSNNQINEGSDFLIFKLFPAWYDPIQGSPLHVSK